MAEIQKPKRKQRTLEEDLELLNYLTTHSVKDAVNHFKTTDPALRSWIYRLRKRIKKLKLFLKEVQKLQSRSDRVKKFTTSADMPEIDAEGVQFKQ